MKTLIKKKFPISRNLRFRGSIGHSFLASIASALLLSAATTQATTLTVTSANDSGAGTLRQAILDASPGDTINFAPGIITINLTSGELLINKDMTIYGPGPNALTVRSAQGQSGIFGIGSVTAAISGLTISNGASFPVGGGIYNSGTLTISNCTISGNTVYGAFHGGSSFPGQGGGIYNSGLLTISNCTISGNTASCSCPFAPGEGAGIFNLGSLTITNSTVSGNSADNQGGGIFNAASLTISNCTISGNMASDGGGTYNSGTLTVRNTIIALNMAAAPDVSGTLTSQGFNLIGNNAGATISPPQSSDQIGTPGSPIDPLLGPLQNNGGPTLTMALLAGSPAINTGDPNAPLYDQRGYGRVGVPDVGAFEFGPVRPPFFNGELPLGGGWYYLQFANGTPFGYYSYLSDPHFIYHLDLGFEYLFDANDASHGIYFYDFASSSFFYTSPTLFPDLYDFSLDAWLYYAPDVHNPGRYSHNPRWFYNFATGQWITL